MLWPKDLSGTSRTKTPASRGRKDEARLLLLQDSRGQRAKPQGSLVQVWLGLGTGLCEGCPGGRQGWGWARGITSRLPWHRGLPVASAA